MAEKTKQEEKKEVEVPEKFKVLVERDRENVGS